VKTLGDLEVALQAAKRECADILAAMVDVRVADRIKSETGRIQNECEAHCLEERRLASKQNGELRDALNLERTVANNRLTVIMGQRETLAKRDAKIAELSAEIEQLRAWPSVAADRLVVKLNAQWESRVRELESMVARQAETIVSVQNVVCAK
jgi:uncharacterized coiled-coil protein SlyX